MITAPIPSNEIERLAELHALRILDTPYEERFDRITRLATKLFDVPFASVSMVDADRLWLKSKQGLKACQGPRDTSICGHAIAHHGILVVSDTKLDERFADNPSVIGDPHFRFYAGRALSGPAGHKVGTFCISDVKPRVFTEADRKTLNDLAGMVEQELKMVDLIKIQRDFISTKEKLIESQKYLSQELRDAAEYVKSLLPLPSQGAVKTDWRFAPSSTLGGDAFGYHWLDADHFSIYLLDVSGHGVGAALLSVSVVNALRSRALPAADFTEPSQVLGALNKIYPMETQGDKYFSIWYGVYNQKKRSLHYSTAGHPPAVLIQGSSAEQNKMRELGRGGPPIGILPSAAYESETLRLSPFNRLYLFSDGVYEITRPDGERGSIQEWLDYLSKESLSPKFSLDQILRDLKNERGSDSFQDDVSIVEASFA